MTRYKITLSVTVDAQEYPAALIAKLDEVLVQQMESSADVHGRVSIEGQHFLRKEPPYPECYGGNASSETPALPMEPAKDS